MRKLLLLAAIFTAACSTTPKPVTQPEPAANPPLLAPHGFDLTGMDTTARPCDDFYQYAVGKWRQTHPLPGTYSRFGRFEELADRNRDRLRQILEQDASMTSAAGGSPEQKIGDFYASCMNE